LSNLRLPWKHSCPGIFHCIECTFYTQNFWATCACPEKLRVPWYYCIEGRFFIFWIFEQLALTLKNRVCPEIFQDRGAAAPPNPPPRTPVHLTEVGLKHLLSLKIYIFDICGMYHTIHIMSHDYALNFTTLSVQLLKMQETVCQWVHPNTVVKVLIRKLLCTWPVHVLY